MSFTIPDFQTILLCLLGGLLPALLWLWFWLREDPHPEPRKRIFWAFVGGMLVVPLVVPFEGAVRSAFGDGLVTVILWAAIEELFKLAAAVITTLRSKDDDEPVDPVIYMLTTALGFAALENALYIFTPASTGNLAGSIDAGTMRFIGATLLHLVASASIGVSIGLAFYKSRVKKVFYLLAGLAVAITLHSLFNFFIINSSPGGAVFMFYSVWMAVIALGLFFEKLKQVHEQGPQGQ